MQASFTQQVRKLYTSFSLRYIGSAKAKNLFTYHLKLNVSKILTTGQITSNKPEATILLSYFSEEYHTKISIKCSFIKLPNLLLNKPLT